MKFGNICRFVSDTLLSSGPRSLWNGTPGQGARKLKCTDSVTFYDTLPVPKNPTTRDNFYSPRLDVGRSLSEGAQRALHPIGSWYGRKQKRSPPETQRVDFWRELSMIPRCGPFDQPKAVTITARHPGLEVTKICLAPIEICRPAISGKNTLFWLTNSTQKYWIFSRFLAKSA